LTPSGIRKKERRTYRQFYEDQQSYICQRDRKVMKTRMQLDQEMQGRSFRKSRSVDRSRNGTGSIIEQRVSTQLNSVDRSLSRERKSRDRCKSLYNDHFNR